MKPTAEQRFWAKVDKNGRLMAHMSTNCWRWTAGQSTGYGVLRIGSLKDGSRRNIYAHRFSWAIHNGAPPDDKLVLHHCDNPECTRPDHLFMGTHAQNSRDMVAKGRAATGERSGLRLHPERNPAFVRPECVPRGEAHWSNRKPHLRRRGEGHGMAKLSAADVTSIRAAFASGTRRSELAKTHGVGWCAVDAIVSRKTWTHLP